MPPKTPKTPRAKGKTPAKGRSKSKDAAAPFGASPAALLGALVALVVAVLLATSNLGFVVATIRGSAAGEDASPGGGGGGAPPASPASSQASSRAPAAGAGGAPASLGDDETARLIDGQLEIAHGDQLRISGRPPDAPGQAVGIEAATERP